ncbi:hypothetical protein TRVA0_029S00386 [Trichomonascus vanleenenianus]|uniref:zinc-binding alcohol dehydrogenase family protein n=1 Tax=Trichomonascus vanleenenianus TaxID=2268995 RepID=UPI003ECAF58C
MAPSTQKAIVTVKQGVAQVVNDRPLPKLRDDYILVKTVAVALNPTDWKHIDYLVSEPGYLSGCDYAGIVEEVGPKVTKSFQKGDRVYGVVHGANIHQKEDGAFAEYIVAKGDVQCKIPDNLSFEQAATLGVGISTVGQGLYQSLGLALPTNPITSNEPVLIYGGSSATGTLGIQFAKLSGYKVITTCSPKNFDMVKSLGADAVFDYRDPKCAEKIRESANNQLVLAWDTISSAESARICSDALARNANAQYSGLLGESATREDIKSKNTLAYSSMGEPFKKGPREFPASRADFEHAVAFVELARKLLSEGKVKPHPHRTGKGLEEALEGLDLLRKNKVSGEKLVYLI